MTREERLYVYPDSSLPAAQSREDEGIRLTIAPKLERILLSLIDCDDDPDWRRERLVEALLDAALGIIADRSVGDEVGWCLEDVIPERYSHPRPHTAGYWPRKRKIRASRRRKVFERDAYRCRHCGSWEHLSVDHIHPEALGGSDDLDNLQTLCHSCNSRKGTRV